jgi:hypothetical protein
MHEDSALADNYDDIRNIIDFLIKHKNYELDHPDVKEKISKLRKFEKIFCCKTFFYQEHVKKLQGNDDEIIRQGTVGAFLFSCFLNTRFPNKECSPMCLNDGLKNPSNPRCDKNVFWKRNNRLQLLTTHKELKNKETLVYLANNEKLDDSDILVFQSNEIEKIKILQQEQDYINFSEKETIIINERKISNNKDYYWWLIIIFIILIIGFFLFIVSKLLF